MDNSKKLKIMAMNALLASVSLCLSIISSYLPIPFLPVLKIDLSDFPIFMSTLLFNSFLGHLILFIVALLKSIFFSSTGWCGFAMRMVNIVAIFFLKLYKSDNKKIIFCFVLATIFPVFIKLIMNFLFLTKIYFMPEESAKSIILKVVLPYNLIKQVVNLTLAFIFTKKLEYENR